MRSASDSLASAIEKMVDRKVGKAGRKAQSKTTATVTGTDGEGKVWVRLSGAESDTPISKSYVESFPGDIVGVVISGGKAVIESNLSNPSAGVSGVSETKELAEGTARSQLVALKTADAAKTDAQSANGTAAAAQANADLAKIAAAEAQSSATEAAKAAEVANASATEAKASAATANTAANDALVQVATVEDVLGAVNWIAEHGEYTLTGDTTVDPDKVYYTRTGSGTQSDPYIYTAVPEPTDEGLPGYYELHVDQAVSQYVASHLALGDAGLYVLKDDSGYKVLLSNTGMSVIDGNAHEVVRYGESIGFDDERPFSIGNEDAYVVFAPATATEEAKVIIGGNVLLGSNKPLSELMAELEGTIIFKVTEEYDQDQSTVTLTAHVYQGGRDTADQYPDSCYAWYRKDEGNVPLVPIGDGREQVLTRESVGYGAAIVCHFTPPNDSVLLDEDDDILTDSQDVPISGRTPSSNYVRLADLETTATVFDTDKLLIVGTEQEKLVTVDTLKDLFGDGDYERLDNRPSIEGVTLSGDKTFQELGIFQTDGQGYDVPDDYTLSTLDINALWANAQPIGA